MLRPGYPCQAFTFDCDLLVKSTSQVGKVGRLPEKLSREDTAGDGVTPGGHAQVSNLGTNATWIRFRAEEQEIVGLHIRVAVATRMHVLQAQRALLCHRQLELWWHLLVFIAACTTTEGCSAPIVTVSVCLPCAEKATSRQESIRKGTGSAALLIMPLACRKWAW